MTWWSLTKGGIETLGDIQTKSVREDAPEFKRIYKMRLDDNAAMELTAWTFLGRRTLDGELTQPDGRWVDFDPERPADEILDPRLIPLIEARVKEVRALDREFMRSAGPAEFTDETGQRWKRA